MKNESANQDTKTTPDSNPVSSAPELVEATKDTHRESNPVPAKKSEAATLLEGWTPEPAADAVPSVGVTNADQPETDPLADQETDNMVDEIVAAEGDQVLEIEDAVTAAQDEPAKKPSPTKRFILFLKKPIIRWSVVVIVVAAIFATVFMPELRYEMFNLVGIRSTSSLTVIDSSTRQPLKNVMVQIGSSESLTDEKGIANLHQVKLGTQGLSIEKRGFASVSKPVTIGWGSNPLGDTELSPTGTQYRFAVVDYVSEKPLSGAEIVTGESSAVTDKTGRSRLTVADPGEKDLVVEVTLTGYRKAEVTVKPDTKDEIHLRLVPARKHLFVSKRSGTFDIYSVYADGKQEKLVLKGSGSERPADLVLVPHPANNMVAYVSTRGNQANSDGYLLSNLILIDSNSGETTNVGSAEHITILGWSGDRLLYSQANTDKSYDSSEKYSLMSYNYKTAENKQLAQANYFNSALLFGGQVYYAPNSGAKSSSARFYRINIDGTNNQAILGEEVGTIIRVNYGELALAVQQQWFSYLQGAAAPTKRSAAPANLQSRTYVDNPDGKHSAWVDIRDGKGVLLSYDLGTKTDKVLVEAPGLSYPVYWLDDTTLMYRIGSPTETADYVVSTKGGKPIKLRDVTPTQGLGALFAPQQ